jgi:hypothetical protein
MNCSIIASKGKKAAEIAEDFKEDLHFFTCKIYSSIEDVPKVMKEIIAIFIITIQNTMNTYISDLDKMAQDTFFFT